MLKFSVSFLIITRVNGVINGLNPLLNGLGIAAAFGLAKMNRPGFIGDRFA